MALFPVHIKLQRSFTITKIPFHKRKGLWRTAKSPQLQSDREKYKQCRKKVKSEIKEWYWHHVQSLQNSNNPKRFWTFIKSRTKSRSIPPEVFLENQKASNSFDKAQLFSSHRFLQRVLVFPISYVAIFNPLKIKLFQVYFSLDLRARNCSLV